MLALFGLLTLAIGCNSNLSTKAGAISVSDPSGTIPGQLTSLLLGAKVRVTMTPVDDPVGGGVDWSVICGGSPVTGGTTGGACGTISPTHTASGSSAVYTAPTTIPIGNTVTITASVTGDPSAVSSVTLTVLPPSITVSLLYAPTSLSVGGTGSFTASLTNDDTAAGVTWSATCGLSSCGSFSPTVTAGLAATTYTAPLALPPGGTVTVTATSVADPTKSASTTITILSIAVSVAPNTFYVETTGAYRRVSFVATVTNDISGLGVNWTVSCNSTAACGSVTLHTTGGTPAVFLGPATAPTDGIVTVTATSVADPTQSASAIVKVIATTPIVVTMSAAPPASLSEGTQSTLAATVANDSSNAGVSWTATCATAGACGSFSVSPAHTASSGTIVYTAPATVPNGGVVTITASSAATGGTPANPAVAATTITATPPTIAFLLQPPAGLSANQQAPVSAVVTNDIAPGGVTWAVQCGSSAAGGCGYVQPYQTPSGDNATYTAPPVPPTGPVTIVASSTSAPSVKVSSTPVTISAPSGLTVGFLPAPITQLQEATSVSLNAAVGNDASGAGVDWAVCTSGCGFFTVTPEIPPPASTPNALPTLPVTVTSVSGWPNGVPILYTAPATPPTGGSLTITATAHADGRTSAAESVTITSDGRGPAVKGTVQVGNLALAGAQIALYTAGTSGYASPSTLLAAPRRKSLCDH